MLPHSWLCCALRHCISKLRISYIAFHTLALQTDFEGVKRHGRAVFVDLAGSERLKLSKVLARHFPIVAFGSTLCNQSTLNVKRD
jgi:hypothetical protein